MRTSGGRGPILWLGAAYLLLAVALSSWRGAPDSLTLRPRTPLDATNGRLAEEWLFLEQMRGLIAPGSTFTVLATDLPREMTLFMMAYGLMSGRTPVPSSYHGVPYRFFGRKTRYVLAFPCGAADRERLRPIAFNPAGCLFVRPQVPR